jgi:hypothetical protein
MTRSTAPNWFIYWLLLLMATGIELLAAAAAGIAAAAIVLSAGALFISTKRSFERSAEGILGEHASTTTTSDAAGGLMDGIQSGYLMVFVVISVLVGAYVAYRTMGVVSRLLDGRRPLPPRRDARV